MAYYLIELFWFTYNTNKIFFVLGFKNFWSIEEVKPLSEPFSVRLFNWFL
jgi:hypothetical protein